MAGKKRTPAAPAWFRAGAYDAASALDAGDWLLNLALRRWLHDEPTPATEDALRRVGPVLRRGDPAQVRAMHLADVHRWVYSFNASEWGGDPFTPFDEACRRPQLPTDVWEALQRGCTRDGITPLGVSELYTFERMLPDEIRTAGASFKPTDSLARYPRAFGGNLDDAFGEAPKKQMLGRFVRVDLALPDDVLHADLQRYLKRERQRLAAMGGPQPYREAAESNKRAHDLRTLASIGLLPFLDLDRWQRAQRLGLSFGAVRELAGIGKEREAELRHYVVLAQRQLHLHAWFARLERSVRIEPKRRSRTARPG